MFLGEWIQYMLFGNPFGVLYCLLLYLCLWRRPSELTSELLNQFWKVWLLMGFLCELLLLIPWAIVQQQWLTPDIILFIILFLIVLMIAGIYGGKAAIQRTFPGLFTGIAFLWPLLVLEGCKFGVVSSSSITQYSLVQCFLFGSGITVGWGSRLILFLAIRHQLHDAPIPKYFGGFGMTILLVILMRMSFMGFAGIL